jgi:quercetin dioxygenase-like cupin family protein
MTHGLMKKLLLASCLLGGAATAVLGQGAPVPTFTVPAIREPHHFVKLDNDYVRVLDVTVEPFSGTLYHIHENPYVYVSIGAATLKAQVLGSNEIVDLNLKDGEVRFSPAVTHRVGNIAATPFRNITIQIQGRDNTPPPARMATTASSAGAAVALENELVRMDRVTLGPGQSSGAHTHPKSHLLVAVHPGTLKLEAAGYPTETRTFKAGDFDWHTGGYSHTLTNTGASSMEFIEVVWK